METVNDFIISGLHAERDYLRSRVNELEEREALFKAIEVAARKFVNKTQPYPKEYDHLRFALIAFSEYEDGSP